MHEDAYTIMRDGITAPQGHAGDPVDAPTSRGGSPRRRRGRLLAAAAGFAAGSVLAVAGGVWASHQFSDVPASHAFHADIDWMVDHGIAEGYSDGTFRPTAAVTRQAAAAYLHRYNGTIQVRKATSNPAPGTVVLRTVSCPTGKRAVAGGGTAGDVELVVNSSGVDATGTAWYVRWVTRDGQSIDPGNVEVHVLCVPA